MSNIRKAQISDLGRIAEIEVFNYRLNFFPIFKSEWFYFVELTVENVAKRYENMLDDICVYEDVAVQGFMMKKDDEIVKLFVGIIIEQEKKQEDVKKNVSQNRIVKKIPQDIKTMIRRIIVNLSMYKLNFK